MKRFALVIAAVVAVLVVGIWQRGPIRQAIDEQFFPKPKVTLSVRLASLGLKRGQPVFVRIIKQTSELELWMDRGTSAAPQWVLMHTFPVCKWSGTLGPKLREGDGQAPEGFYVVTAKALHPASNYHRAFNLGFPNAYDRANGRTGSFLMVHGDCRSVGCFAMTDPAIEDIYGLVEAALAAGQAGVPVHVFPFRMTSGAPAARADAAGFAEDWQDLREGWDLFESTRRPPVAFACGQRYRFAATLPNCTPISGL
jgi:murein L,D-transpeptidase YafK